MTFLSLVILSFVTYRATRFVRLDSMFDTTIGQLEAKRDEMMREAAHLDRREDPRHFLLRKLLMGATCAFCISVWFAAGALAFWAAATDYEVSWASLAHWLGVSTGAMVVYRFIDPD